MGCLFFLEGLIDRTGTVSVIPQVLPNKTRDLVQIGGEEEAVRQVGEGIDGE